MMEVTSAVKPSTGSAFSIDSIMSSRRDRDSRESAVAAGSSRDSDRGGLSVVSHRSSPPSATVTTSCVCPPVSPLGPLSSPSSISHPHPGAGHHHHSPNTSPISGVGDGLHPGLSSVALAARNGGNGLHPPHLSLSVSAATEAALMHNRAIAAAAAAQNAHTLHTQQQQAAAAMAGLGALDPHGAALTAGGVGTIPTLPSFSTLTHHPSDRGLAALQALSHKIQGLPPSLGGVHGLPGGGGGGPLGPHHHGLGNGLAGLGPKHVLPFYSWFSRPGGYWAHRLPGSEPSFLLPFRKPKRIRTAFSPSQLLRLEHAFEKNHYVVGQERKDLAATLNLTETQVKVWFQNRRTKYKRVKAEEEGLPIPDDIEVDDEPDSDPEDV